MDLRDRLTICRHYRSARRSCTADRSILVCVVTHDLGYGPLSDISPASDCSRLDGFFRGLLHSDCTGVYRHDSYGRLPLQGRRIASNRHLLWSDSRCIQWLCCRCPTTRLARCIQRGRIHRHYLCHPFVFFVRKIFTTTCNTEKRWRDQRQRFGVSRTNAMVFCIDDSVFHSSRARRLGHS